MLFLSLNAIIEKKDIAIPIIRKLTLNALASLVWTNKYIEQPITPSDDNTMRKLKITKNIKRPVLPC